MQQSFNKMETFFLEVFQKVFQDVFKNRGLNRTVSQKPKFDPNRGFGEPLHAYIIVTVTHYIVV